MSKNRGSRRYVDGAWGNLYFLRLSCVYSEGMVGSMIHTINHSIESPNHVA